ncbi:transposable element Tc3 transposase [Trichonephila clavipes]|nr:transposable element Tc3 transposase [Trichonephila clavipes]
MDQLGPGRATATMGASSRSPLSLNKIKIQIISNVISPAAFSEKLGISDDMLSDYMWCHRLSIGLANHRASSILIQSKGGSRPSRFVRFKEVCTPSHDKNESSFSVDQQRRFVEWAQNEIVVVPDFHKRILLSDEAHFWLNGYVNKQNCRIWSEANPQVYVKTPLHPEKLTVWCVLWAGGILLQKR